MEFLARSNGRAGALGAVVGAVLLAVAVIVLVTLAVLRLTGVVLRHRTRSTGAVAVLAAAWVACAVLGVQIVPDVPVAAHAYYDRLLQVRAGLQDRDAFAAEASVDAFRYTPSSDLLTALRGKDVVIAFVESYGRVAVEDPELAPQIGAVLEDGNRRLRAAGFASRSAFLTSPTVTGISWLAHSTLQSGLWIDNQQRYSDLLASDRLTLSLAFRRAGWRTVGVAPANNTDWHDIASFYGLSQTYDTRTLGYRGSAFSFSSIPDQYTLSAFERLERDRSTAPRSWRRSTCFRATRPGHRCPSSSTGRASVTVRSSSRRRATAIRRTSCCSVTVRGSAPTSDSPLSTH